MNEPGTLAHRVDYRRLAVQGGRVAGTVPMTAVPRVSALMARAPDDGDEIAAELVFSEDAQRRVHVAGRVCTTLRLTCQRCLRHYEQTMDASVSGVVVADDEAAANVPREYEPMLAEGDLLDIHALVGDELLLALPSVGRCDRSDCLERFEQAPSVGSTDGASRQDNPFAALKKITRDD